MKIFFIQILFFSITSCDFHTALDYYNEAVKLEKKGNYKRAILFHNKAIKKEPKFRISLNNRAADKADLGDFKGSIEDYKKVLEFDSDNTAALFGIGNNFSDLGEHAKAVKYYSAALKTKGASSSFSSAEGRTLVINSNFDTKKFDSDMNYNIPDCNIYFERGIEYLTLKKYDKAITDITKSLKSNNAEMDCYFLLGKSYLGKKDSINACQNFIKSAKLGDKESREMLKKHCI